MILSHARLPVPTLPHEAKLSVRLNQKVNQQKLTKNLLDLFYSSRRQGISKNTVLFYHRCLDKAIGIDLTATGINYYLSSLKCGNGKHAYYRAIRALCNWLFRNDYLEDNPLKKVDPPKPTKRILPSLTIEQLNNLLEQAVNPRDKAIISLFADSGMRLKEDFRRGKYKVISPNEQQSSYC